MKVTWEMIHAESTSPWKLRNDPKNLQVLCSDCNCGKSANFNDDWR